ncbi:MAG: hypothetical protein ACTSUE_18920 [Promethearchaeota archaeon]
MLFSTSVIGWVVMKNGTSMEHEFADLKMLTGFQGVFYEGVAIQRIKRGLEKTES